MNYREIKTSNINKTIRIFFYETYNNNNWHMDKEDRIIKVLHGENWFIQFENQIPKLLIKNNNYFINKNIYHRLLNINSNKNLILSIQKTNLF